MSEPSLDKNLFCSPYPASEAAVVPEYFRPQTIEDLTPYECVYPYAHMLVRDIDKGTLYINTRNSLESDDIAPTYIGGRFGVMKVCQMQGDQINSLFIVDMRYVEPSSLNGDYLCPDSAQDEMTRNNRQATIESNGAVPVAAAVFADPDGKPHFVGDVSLQSHVQTLMSRTDELAEAGQSWRNDMSTPVESSVGGVALTQLTDNTWRIA